MEENPLQNYKGGNIQKTFTKFLIVSDKLEVHFFLNRASQKCTLKNLLSKIDQIFILHSYDI